MNWQLIVEILYVALLIGVAIKIINDTESSAKASAYILLIFILPIVGVIIYFSFGLNYRKSKIYDKKLHFDEHQTRIVNKVIETYKNRTRAPFKKDFGNYFGLNRMLFADNKSLLTHNNKIKLLLNGENKFPDMIAALRKAKHHIHIEYYIYENDEIGRAIADVLIEKARSGVEVRFIYDDFGSRGIRKNLVKEMRDNGVQAYSFYKVIFIMLANRLNYRNHRKIVIIDGEIGFIGGINVSDKYINNNSSDLYWRDTHLMIEGEAVWRLQSIFIADWNFASNEIFKINGRYFKQQPDFKVGSWVQIVSSGPDSKNPSILYSYLQALTIAKHEVLITTPYLIPNEEFLHALHMAVLRGVKVKILVPNKSDSLLVDAVSRSYFNHLLESGIEIYLYRKGFVHAKTMVCDHDLSMVGTANLDNRSFDLNFEVNALVYDKTLANQLKVAFENDLKVSTKIIPEEWNKRRKSTQFFEKFLRLVSPLL